MQRCFSVRCATKHPHPPCFLPSQDTPERELRPLRPFLAAEARVRIFLRVTHPAAQRHRPLSIFFERGTDEPAACKILGEVRKSNARRRTLWRCFYHRLSGEELAIYGAHVDVPAFALRRVL
jgi:hypothetical protein